MKEKLTLALKWIPLILVLMIAISLAPRYIAYMAPEKPFSDCAKFADALAGGVDLKSKTQNYNHSSPPVVIRYSDAGEIVNYCDHAVALNSVEQLDGSTSKLIVVYVHGWTINAGPAWRFTGLWKFFRRTIHGSENHGIEHKLLYNFELNDEDVIKLHKSEAYRNRLKRKQERKDRKKGEENAKLFGPQDFTNPSIVPCMEGNLRVPGSEYENFAKFIETLESSLNNNTGCDDRMIDVVGIFVSWKSDLPIPGLKRLTYLDRRNTADTIGRGGQLSTLFGAIENIRRKDEGDQIIYIGHSFGARILYGSVAQRMIVDVQNAYIDKQPYELVDGGQDLVVLANPALEVASYRAIDSFNYTIAFHPDQRPLMLVMQSDEDFAVRYVFGIMQTYIGLQPSRSQAKPIGWTVKTHDLTNVKDTTCERVVNSTDPDRTFWFDDFCVDNIRLRRTNAERNETYTDKWSDSPFIVAMTDENILSSHGLLNDKNVGKIGKWLVSFIQRNAPVQITIKVPDQFGYAKHPIIVRNVDELRQHLIEYCVTNGVRTGLSIQGSDDEYDSELKPINELVADDLQDLTDFGPGYSYFLEAPGYKANGVCD